MITQMRIPKKKDTTSPIFRKNTCLLIGIPEKEHPTSA
jgi:hypothetical protein